MHINDSSTSPTFMIERERGGGGGAPSG